MRYTKFVIRSFKGIKRAEIDLSKKPEGNIYTLVGLNESGKTTILEAINSFSPDRDGVARIFDDIIKEIQPKDLVPKAQKSNFTSTISVVAHLELDDQEKGSIVSHAQSELGILLDQASIPTNLVIEKNLHFENSDHMRTQNIWYFRPRAKIKGRRKTTDVTAPDPNWHSLIRFIQQQIPTISYFPTFLFDFPDRIYLSNPPDSIDPGVNTYYVQIVQDVLDYLGGGMTISTHIVDRVEKTVKDDSSWDFLSFWRSDHREQIAHVMLKIGHAISQVIFERWNEIFGSKPKGKSIEVDWNVEPRADGTRSVYLRFQIHDGTSKFDISERSLGFRWFFCFLLFTQFRAARRLGTGALFLFDEPASNLHSKAQKKLLESFSRVTGEKNVIIYSTHSHYMINPLWLENAFIVINKGIDYEEQLSIDKAIQAADTDIIAVKYRDFVGQTPDRVTYYQPILDALDFVSSPLELGHDALFVEGKNDFYALKYFELVHFQDKNPMTIVPSSGAGDLGPIISLYLGWGKKFIILLDADKAGAQAKARYEEQWLLPEGTVLLLSDIDEKWKGKRFERLLTDADLTLISSWCGKAKAGKADIGRFFQESVAMQKKREISPALEEAISKILDATKKRLK